MEQEITIEALLENENAVEVVNGLPFEKGLKLLEELVEMVEDGNLPLSKAVDSYGLAMTLISALKEKLNQAESRLKVLKEETEGEFSLEDE